VRADDEGVRLEQLSLRHADGVVRARGRARLDGFRLGAFDGSVELERLPLARGSFIAVVGGELDVHVQPLGDGLTGDVSVRRGTARLVRPPVDRALQSTAPLEDVTFVGVPKLDAASPVLVPVRVEALGARLGEPLKVHSHDLAAELVGGLRLDVRDGHPKLTGTVEARRGAWIDLYGRRFTVERLRFVFDDAHPIDPIVELRATREIVDSTVGIEVAGSQGRYDLHLTADPPRYDSRQIAALIVSGEPGNVRTAGSLEPQVMAALSGVLLGKLKGAVGQLPVDIVKVENPSSATGQSRVEIGKYLTERVYLGYVHRFVLYNGPRPINANQAQLELRLPRSFSLDTMYGDAGVGSFDLSWTWRR
jgi:translocation and assembly module TamB